MAGVGPPKLSTSRDWGCPVAPIAGVGSTDQEGSEDDLVALYAVHQIETFDGAVLPDTDLSDIDPAAVQEYRRLRERANPSAEDLAWSDEELLRALSAAVRQVNELRPTVAGLLLLAPARRCAAAFR